MQFSFDIDNDPSNTDVFFKLSKSLSLTNEAYASQSMQYAYTMFLYKPLEFWNMSNTM